MTPNDDYMMFPSRNRGSFDFKPSTASQTLCLTIESFDLVLEVLLRASDSTAIPEEYIIWFRSRARGAFQVKAMMKCNL